VETTGTPCCPAPRSDEDLLRNRFRDVNKDSGKGEVFIHLAPESIIHISPESVIHIPGMIIHMPRNTHYSETPLKFSFRKPEYAAEFIRLNKTLDC
jgi:hypothetical protein